MDIQVLIHKFKQLGTNYNSFNSLTIEEQEQLLLHAPWIVPAKYYVYQKYGYPKKYIKPPDTSKKELFKIYKNKVKRLTNINKHHIPNIHLREFKKYDIDHIVPIYHCWKLNIPIELCADPVNLRILKHKDNFIKGTTLYPESYILLESWGYKL